MDWIRRTREAFPSISITAGPWVNKIGHLAHMLDAGADSITKFPAIKLFNSIHAKTMEGEITGNGYGLEGTLTKMPAIDFQDIEELDLDGAMKQSIIEKANEYISSIGRKQSLVLADDF